MASEAEKRAKKKYASKIKRYVVDLYPTDAEMIEWLSKQEKPQTYIKELIKKDVNK